MQTIQISNNKRATYVGILILVAYSMLAYSISNHIIVGVITDVLSGLAVIGIPLFLYPIFNTPGNKTLNYAYLGSRLAEGIIMIIGGVFIMIPSLEEYRNALYENLHIYFFIVGATFLYFLFYKTKAIPKYISLWGILATVSLLIVTIIKIFGQTNPLLDILIAPIVLNEIFLAIWLIAWC